jgi:protease IV
VSSPQKRGFFGRLGALLSGVVKTIRVLLNLVFLGILVIVLYTLLGQDIKPLPNKAALLLQPSGVLVEERTFSDPITQFMEQSQPYDAETPVRDLIDALKYAATDTRITGVVIDLNHLKGGGISKMADVANAIEKFQASGKPVIAIADSYDQQQYYLASFADEIIVNPMGGVMITGYGYYGSYFKNAADKLKINFHVFRAGQFKSAVEPFTRNDMSDEARENTRAWIAELWQYYTDTVESQRDLQSGGINQFVSTLPARLGSHQGDLSSLAMEAGLVDKVASRPEVREMLTLQFGANEDTFSNIHHKTYLLHQRIMGADTGTEQVTDTGKVGVIIASGNILDGEQMEGTIGGDSLSRLIRMARNDETVKALVLRVDSPGGSAFASDLIRQELLSTKEKMPVIVSMGSLAASGGYWISAEADEIWAQPTTITGSIGVFGIVPTFEDSLGAMGISSDGVGTTELADFNHLDRPLSEPATQIVQLSIQNIYHRFLSLVAGGRDTTVEAVADIAAGRVWTGRQGKEIGLVDKLGGLNEAISSAASKVGLDPKQVKYISRPLTFQEQLLKQIAEGSAKIVAPVRNLLFADVPSPLIQKAQRYQRHLKQLGQLNDPEHAYLQCFGCTAP